MPTYATIMVITMLGGAMMSATIFPTSAKWLNLARKDVCDE